MEASGANRQGAGSVDLGCALRKRGRYWYLRIFIDRPEGITLDECEAMSRAINDPLDRLDPIDQEYCLEVCSPGIHRELTRPEHFAAFLGAVVSVRLICPLEDGRRELIAILHQYGRFDFCPWKPRMANILKSRKKIPHPSESAMNM